MRNEKEGHPGWSVQFKDGSWLGGAHGWFRTDDAFYADSYDSAEDAQRYLKDVRKSDSDFNMDAKVVPAWEPLVAHLRFKISRLEEANTISPSKILDITMSLEQVLYELRGKE